MDKHNFWKTQPIVKTEIISEKEFGPIENPNFKDIRKDPYPLPSGFEFHTINLDDLTELNELELTVDIYIII